MPFVRCVLIHCVPPGFAPLRSFAAMNTFIRTVAMLALLLASAGCAASRSGGASATISALGFLGDKIIPNSLTVDGTPVGGLSGIDRAPDGTWYLISDDRSD